jgi:hypothetical protein
MRKLRVLFVCKQRIDSYGTPIGLINSATFAARTLKNNGIEARVVSVVDNSFIDREVHAYKPTHVIIEALWVTPIKFYELLPLHPTNRLDCKRT